MLYRCFWIKQTLHLNLFYDIEYFVTNLSCGLPTLDISVSIFCCCWKVKRSETSYNNVYFVQFALRYSYPNGLHSKCSPNFTFKNLSLIDCDKDKVFAVEIARMLRLCVCVCASTSHSSSSKFARIGILLIIPKTWILWLIGV